MARKPRVHFPGALYHVIARGNRHQPIFFDEYDCERYLYLLREYKRRFCFLLYAYVLMENHLHLLMEVEELPLSRIMHDLQFRYTHKFNSRHKKDGHLFQGRYKAILCDRDTYLLELSAYIHLNPVRAGIIENPRDYRWSSYGAYVKKDVGSLVDENFLLSLFSKNKADARQAYAGFVESRIREGHKKEFYQVEDQRFLGDEEFIAGITKFVNERIAKNPCIALDKIVSVVGFYLDIQRESFFTHTRNRRAAWGRSVVGYLGRKLCNYENKSIAQFFKRDPSVLTKGIRHVESRIISDRVLQKQLVEIESILVKGRS
jgi:REP element-mobilizing transposase RayT